MKMCSHIIVLVVKMGCMDKFLKFLFLKFMKWYRTMKYKLSFTALVEDRKAINSRKKKNRAEVSTKGANKSEW